MTEAKIPKDSLEGLMKKVFLERKLDTGLFWDAVLKANLYVPLAVEKVSSKITPDESVFEKDIVQLGVGSKGVYVLWLFTSPETMNEYTEKEFPYLELPGETMFKKISETKHDVVLIGPEGMTLGLDRGLVDSLSKGVVPQPSQDKVEDVPKDTQVMVGAVNEDTEALEKKFISLFETLANIQEASFVKIADHKGPRLLLGLKLTKEDRDELKKIAGLVAKAAEGVLDPGKTMDITLLSGKLKGAFSKWGKTFYKK